MVPRLQDRGIMGQRIRTTATKGYWRPAKVKLGGWLSGKEGTYLRFELTEDALRGDCLGWIDGQKLYRLAKAIVRQFEENV